MNRRYIKRIAVTSALAAVALIFGYVETLVPIPVGIPGIKLGIANIAVVCAMFSVDTRCAAEVNLIRILLSAVLFSSPSALIYALSGAAFSFVAMAIVKRLKFDIIVVSAVGGICHNIGQIAAAAIITKTPQILYWLLVLFAVGLITGIIIGIISRVIVKNIDKSEKI